MQHRGGVMPGPGRGGVAQTGWLSLVNEKDPLDLVPNPVRQAETQGKKREGGDGKTAI